ncbi:hypothetical protein ACHAW6_015347 [Cyclotella cf. meneghiniana]
MSMRLPLRAYYFYLAASFVFAAVNYQWIWNHEDSSSGRHDVDEARRLFGVAPLDDGNLERTRSHDEELSSDISELLYGHDDDDDDDDDEFRSTDHDDEEEEDDDDDDSHSSMTDERGDDGIQTKANVYDHRPKQNRTGTVWNGWPKPDINQNDSRRDEPNEYWWRHSKTCFDVQRICHTRATNEWFYYNIDTTSSSNATQPDTHTKDSFQPSLELRSEPFRYDRGLIAERRVNITVDASRIDLAAYDARDRTLGFSPPRRRDQTACRVSPVPTHVFLQSMFNFMIGEFYARTLLPLHRLMTISRNPSTTTTTTPPWERRIQFYVHTAHGNRKLLEGHKLLLGGMSSRENSMKVMSAVELFERDRGDGEGGDGDCECFERMVFCGYDVYVNDDDEKGRSEDAREDTIPIDRTVEGIPDTHAKYTLWGSSTTADDVKGTGYCGKGEIDQDLYSCEDWARLRRFLASNFQKHYPSLESDVIQFRRQTLLGMNLVDDNYSGNTNEWKFVGLAQRSYRRSWINLPVIMKECNALYQSDSKKKVVCIEVNVENTSSPYEQLLLHRSVDALIGVHGAQLTQAVLLPPHRHVLELLPWVTDYIRGWWVQTRHTPTPLGIIFHNSDLNHVGYSLGRDSVPLCNGVGEVGSQEEKECFLKGKNRKAFIWESRDFVVKPDVIIQYIEQFLLRMQEEPLECNDVQKALDEQFVFYNVWCATTGSADDKISPLDPKLTLRHFYDKKNKKKKKKGD